MTPFELAEYPPESRDPSHYQKLVPGISDEHARAIAEQMSRDQVWVNDLYQVSVHFAEGSSMDGLHHLSIKRRDREVIHDWRDLQHIKNEISGPEREAIELYPAESRRVDSANQYHLWVLPKGGRVPLGFSQRFVVEAPGGAAKQRAFEEHDHAAPKNAVPTHL